MQKRHRACMVLMLAMVPGLVWADWVVEVLNNPAPVKGVPLQVGLRGTGSDLHERYVHTNDILPAGVRVVVPYDVNVRFIGPSGIKVRKQPGRRLDTTLQENHAEVNSGSAGFERQRTGQIDLSGFSAGKGEVKAAMGTTAFTVDVLEEAARITFAVQDGRIEITAPQITEVRGTGMVGGQKRQWLTKDDEPVTLSLRPVDWYIKHGSFLDAKAVFESQLSQAQARGHPMAIMDARMALGDLQLLAGQASEALLQFQSAQADLPSNEQQGYWAAVLQGRRGNALQSLGRLDLATIAFQESFALHRRQAMRPGEFTDIEQSQNIATNLQLLGLWQCSIDWSNFLLRELERRQAGPARHIRVPLLRSKGEVLLAMGQLSEAAAVVQDAQSRLAYWGNGREPLEVAELWLTLGRVEAARGQAGAAEADFNRALTILRRLFPNDAHPLRTDIWLEMANLHHGRSDAAAQTSLALAQKELRQLPQPQPLREGTEQALLGQWLWQAGQAKAALDHWQATRRAWAQVWPDESHPNLPPLLRLMHQAALASPADQQTAADLDKAAQASAAALARRAASCVVPPG